jgi:hypothetical protein
LGTLVIMSEVKVPDFNTKEMSCIMCGKPMFYAKENLVHVCLEESHGILCYFEPDSCWFAASENTSLELAKRGIKFHFIPKGILENADLQPEFNCEYKETQKKIQESV